MEKEIIKVNNKVLNDINESILKLQVAKSNCDGDAYLCVKDAIEILLDAKASLIDTLVKYSVKNSKNSEDRLFSKMLDGAKALCEEHEDIVKNIVNEPTITCVTSNTSTTHTAKIDSDTPCFENIEELNK